MHLVRHGCSNSRDIGSAALLAKYSVLNVIPRARSPDGHVFNVGDNDDSCGSLACVGGTPGLCGSVNPGGAHVRVTCSACLHHPPAQPGVRLPPGPPPLPDNVVAPAASSYGGLCTCPNGKYYHVGDEGSNCLRLQCAHGRAGGCHSLLLPASSMRAVTCASLPPGISPPPIPPQLFRPASRAPADSYRLKPEYGGSMAGVDPNYINGVRIRDGEVPKRIFTFWNDRNRVPVFVTACWQRMAQLNPLYTFQVLYPGIGGLEGPPNDWGFASDDWAHIADCAPNMCSNC